MPLTSVHFELAAAGRETTERANEILNVLADPYSPNRYLFNADSHPAIVGVGYVGDLAITAAACSESVMAKSSEVSSRTPFEDLPYLDIFLIATDTANRKKGYARQLVAAVINLAADHGFDRVEANQPDKARQFWGECGFSYLPFMRFGEYDRYRRVDGVILGDEGVEVTVAPEVNDRLAAFVQAQSVR